MNEYKTGHVASWLKQHDNTIRDWSRRWEKHLSDGANAGRRRYSDEDVRVLATVANYRHEGLSLDAIDKLLDEGKRIARETMPAEPTPEAEEARENVEIVTIPRDTYLLDIERFQGEIERYKADIERLETALESAEDSRDSLQSELHTTAQKLAAAEAKLQIIQAERKPASYWLQIIGVITIALVIIAAIAIVYLSSGVG